MRVSMNGVSSHLAGGSLSYRKATSTEVDCFECCCTEISFTPTMMNKRNGLSTFFHMICYLLSTLKFSNNTNMLFRSNVWWTGLGVFFSALPSLAEKSLQNRIIYFKSESTDFLSPTCLYLCFWVMVVPFIPAWVKSSSHLYACIKCSSKASSQKLRHKVCGVFFQWLLNSFGTVLLKIPGLWEGKWGQQRLLFFISMHFFKQFEIVSGVSAEGWI